MWTRANVAAAFGLAIGVLVTLFPLSTAVTMVIFWPNQGVIQTVVVFTCSFFAALVAGNTRVVRS